MAKVRFSRSESWQDGWRGKRSGLDVFLGNKKVGEITGHEGAGRATEYGVSLPGVPGVAIDYRATGSQTLVQVKAAVRAALEQLPAPEPEPKPDKTPWECICGRTTTGPRCGCGNQKLT